MEVAFRTEHFTLVVYPKFQFCVFTSPLGEPFKLSLAEVLEAGRKVQEARVKDGHRSQRPV